MLIKPGGAQKEIMYFVIFSSKTAFFKLEDLLPECFLYREKAPQLEPLICLYEDNACHVGQTCMEKLCTRLKMLFDEVLPPEIDLVLLYFRKRAEPTSLAAGAFWRNLEDFSVYTLNRSAWSIIKGRGQVMQFQPGVSFFLTGRAPPPEEPDSSEEVSLD